jgi:hypothetical protein
MGWYRKTALIEASQWFKNGDHPHDHVGEILIDLMSPQDRSKDYARLEGAVVRFFRRPEPEYSGDKIHVDCGFTWHNHGWIDDLEGGHVVCPGDWVATGVHGENWAIKPSIFAASYELVKETVVPYDSRPHSRACGISKHDHGPACSTNCPTCSGK